MSYIVKQKAGKHTYVYEATNHWDKVKKQSRQTRKYLGRIDPETNSFIKTKGVRGREAMTMKPKASRDYGNVYLLEEVAKRIGLSTH